MLFTYAPFMNGLFGSAPIKLSLWLDALAVSLVSFAIIEIEKWARIKVQRL
jgi:cation-transporting P-type ATPase F